MNRTFRITTINDISQMILSEATQGRHNKPNEAKLETMVPCDCCGVYLATKDIHSRVTDNGRYCDWCSQSEKCAACFERHHKSDGSFKDDVGNWICKGCESSYTEVKEFIKPVKQAI